MKNLRMEYYEHKRKEELENTWRFSESILIKWLEKKNITKKNIRQNLIIERISDAGFFKILDYLKEQDLCQYFYKLSLHGDLSYLKPYAFQGWENLSSLNLSRNKLTTIPENAFAGTERLGYLINLSNNQISCINKKAFSGKYLNSLILSHNNIKSLDKEVFTNMHNICSYLDLSYNSIEELDESLFEGLLLDKLDLSHNRIRYLPNNIFKSLSGLRDLCLGNNRIQALPEDIFENLTLLRYVNLEENSIKTISPQSVLSQGLKCVVLNRNGIKNIDLGILSKNWYLLCLSENLISDTKLKQILKDENSISCYDNYTLSEDGSIQGLLESETPPNTYSVFQHIRHYKQEYPEVILALALSDSHQWCQPFTEEQKATISAWKKAKEETIFSETPLANPLPLILSGALDDSSQIYTQCEPPTQVSELSTLQNENDHIPSDLKLVTGKRF